MSADKTEKLCDWFDNHAGPPSTMSKDPCEQELAKFLSRRHSFVSRGFTSKPLEEEAEILEKRGYPFMYIVGIRGFKNGSMAEAYVGWVKVCGKPPSLSGEGTELRLAMWVSNFRKRERTIPLGGQTMPNFMDATRRKSKTTMRMVELCQWVNSKGRLPLARSKDKNEKSLRAFLNNRVYGLAKLREDEIKVAKGLKCSAVIEMLMSKRGVQNG